MISDYAVLKIAQICHEVNRAYCASHGNFSNKPWDEAPQWQKESVVDGVRFYINNPGVGPGESHKRWLEVKLADGWKYGPVKNEEKKEHPCFLPYNELPLFHQAKDFIFTEIVNQLKELL